MTFHATHITHHVSQHQRSTYHQLLCTSSAPLDSTPTPGSPNTLCPTRSKIQAEKAIHQQRKQAIALAEKSVRIGWTYADAFKNVRKRLWFKDRDYLFATKDYASALEYIRQCYKFAEIFNLTSTILSKGEEDMTVNQLDAQGHPSTLVEQIK